MCYEEIERSDSQGFVRRTSRGIKPDVNWSHDGLIVAFVVFCTIGWALHDLFHDSDDYLYGRLGSTGYSLFYFFGICLIVYFSVFVLMILVCTWCVFCLKA
jgi:hypothetical protein